MFTVCSDCGTSYDASQPCPRCQATSLPAPARTVAAPWDARGGKQEPWQQTPGARLAVGVLLGVGLSYGLLQLAAALMSALGNQGGQLHPLIGLILFQAVQALALLTGGIFTGAGQRRGPTLGAVVGILSGSLVIAAAFQGWIAPLGQAFGRDLLVPGTLVRTVVLYALPVLHALCGGLGGLIGTIIWKPYPQAGVATSPAGAFASIQAWIQRREGRSRGRSAWVGPMCWPRVLLGTAIAVAGAIWARSVIDFVLLLSEGKLSIMTLWEDQLTYAEVFSLAILIGGCFAGASTPNGLKQGVGVGIGAALGIELLLMSRVMYSSGPVIYPIISTLSLGPLGGWFGSELLPPLARRGRPQRSWFSALE